MDLYFLHQSSSTSRPIIIDKKTSGGSPLVFIFRILRASSPAAPGISSLLLLLLRPDRVRRVPPRWTHPERCKHTSSTNPCQCLAFFREVNTTPPMMISTRTLAPRTRPAFPPIGGKTLSVGVTVPSTKTGVVVGMRSGVAVLSIAARASINDWSFKFESRFEDPIRAQLMKGINSNTMNLIFMGITLDLEVALQISLS